MQLSNTGKNRLCQVLKYILLSKLNKNTMYTYVHTE